MVPGTQNEASTATFAIDGASAVLIDPGGGGGIDIIDAQHSWLPRRALPAVAGRDAGRPVGPRRQRRVHAARRRRGGSHADDRREGRRRLPLPLHGLVHHRHRHGRPSPPARGPIATPLQPGVHPHVRGPRGHRRPHQPGRGRRRRPRPARHGRGYIEITFRPTSGSRIDHDSIDGGEIVLRDAAGVEISLAVPGAGRHDRHLPLRASPARWPPALYTVDYVAGTFADVDGNLNLAEPRRSPWPTPRRRSSTRHRWTRSIARCSTDATTSTSPSRPVAGWNAAAIATHRRCTRPRVHARRGRRPERRAQRFAAGRRSPRRSVRSRSSPAWAAESDTAFATRILAALTLAGAGASLSFRYGFTNSFDTGVVTVAFTDGAWADAAGNPGAAGTQQFAVITQRPVVLHRAVRRRDPQRRRARRRCSRCRPTSCIELDFARQVFTLDFNGSLRIIGLGTDRLDGRTVRARHLRRASSSGA